MRCPNCNTEINENANHCPHCGTPIPRKEDEPTLGRGIVTFIIIGTFSLVGFGFSITANTKMIQNILKQQLNPTPI